MNTQSEYELRRDFESHLHRYSCEKPGESQEFMKYLIGWHRRTKLRDTLTASVCAQLRIRAHEENTNYPSPSAFLNDLFLDMPEPLKLQRRFLGKTPKEQRIRFK